MGLEVTKKSPRRVWAECAYKLTLTDLGKGVLAPCWDTEGPPDIWLYNQQVQEATMPPGKTGLVELFSMGKLLNLFYDVQLLSHYNEQSCLDLSWGGDNEYSDGFKHTQRIYLQEAQAPYGIRAYFECNCGTRANTLYLPVKSNYWACRSCHNIQYRVRSYNRQGNISQLGYFIDRAQELDTRRAKVKRVTYNGQHTRRAKSLMRLVKKWSPEIDHLKLFQQIQKQAEAHQTPFVCV